MIHGGMPYAVIVMRGTGRTEYEGCTARLPANTRPPNGSHRTESAPKARSKRTSGAGVVVPMRTTA
jgi:hypothetical protein